MPTALELTRAGWQAYLAPARHGSPAQPLTASQRAARQALLRKVRAAAALLKGEYGSRRVLLFGSLAHRGWFTPDSDVDLAVEGVSSADYWRAWRAAEESIGDRQVDLIDLADASDSLKRAVQRYGVEL
jgi:predicted nucleotidyltransferase